MLNLKTMPQWYIALLPLRSMPVGRLHPGPGQNGQRPRIQAQRLAERLQKMGRRWHAMLPVVHGRDADVEQRRELGLGVAALQSKTNDRMHAAPPMVLCST